MHKVQRKVVRVDPEQSLTYCKHCNNPNADVVEDTKEGTSICRTCGLVISDHNIDERSEWRTFANDGGDKADPTRVGGPTNDLLDGGQLLTSIVGGKGDFASAARFQHMSSTTTAQRNLQSAFGRIAAVSDRLELLPVVKERAQGLYKQADEKFSPGGRKIDGYVAASLYIACRQEGVPRSIKEICAFAAVPKKQVNRCFKQMLTVLDDALKTVSSSDYMHRFCSQLKLDVKVANAASHIAAEAVKRGAVGGRCPTSVAAASIFLACQLGSKREVTTGQISLVAGVSETTIRNTYKDIFAQRTELVPGDYASSETVEKLTLSG